MTATESNKRLKLDSSETSATVTENIQSKNQVQREFLQFNESDFGIEEFVCPELPSFPAVIKHRYSDFLVNEIQKETGKVEHLTSLTTESTPAIPKSVPADASTDPAQDVWQLAAQYLGEQNIPELKNLLSDTENKNDLKLVLDVCCKVNCQY